MMLYVHTFMWMYAHVWVEHTHTHITHTHTGARGLFQSPDYFLPYFFRHHHSLDLELTNMATVVGQRTPGIGLSSHVELWTHAIIPDLF